MSTNIVLKLTCSACPEQYDAYYEGEKIGYLRLRHGRFTVDWLRPGGPTLYTAAPKGDGAFEYDERDTYLTEAVMALAKQESFDLDDVSYTIDLEEGFY